MRWSSFPSVASPAFKFLLFLAGIRGLLIAYSRRGAYFKFLFQGRHLTEGGRGGGGAIR